MSTSTSEPPQHIDIASIVNLEKSYLEQSPLLNGNGDVTNSSQQAVVLNGMLNNLSQSLNNNTTPYILSFQGDVKQMVDTETDRLMLKKQSIDTALTTQKRMMDINDSYSKRQREYTKIVTAVAIGLALTIVIALFVRAFPFPGSGQISTYLIAAIVFGVFVYSFWTYRDIARRDPIYFDEISLPPVQAEGANLPDVSGGGIKQLAASMGLVCVGGNCCSSYMKWDASNNLCVTDTAATAAATTSTNTTEKFTVYDREHERLGKPFEPSEYDEYTRVIQVDMVSGAKNHQVLF